jgi:hypothetical protein
MESERVEYALRWLAIHPSDQPSRDAIERLLDQGHTLEQIRFMITGRREDNDRTHYSWTYPPTLAKHN